MPEENEGVFSNPDEPEANEEPQTEEEQETENAEPVTRKDSLDSFQQKQRENTEKALEEMDDDKRAAAGISGYSPPNTIKGSEGDNANFDPSKVGEDEEWDPHGGEEEDTPEDYEPMDRPE